MAKAPKDAKSVWDKTREWATFTFSALAFFVSLCVAYVSTIRQSDELSAVVTHAPWALPNLQSQLEVQDEEFTLLLINSGNRPAAVLSVEVVFVQAPTPSMSCEAHAYSEHAIAVSTDVVTTVVKDRDLVSRAVKLKVGVRDKARGIEHRSDQGVFLLPVSKHVAAQDSFTLLVCLRFQVSAPSVDAHFTHMPAVTLLNVAPRRTGGTEWALGTYYDDYASSVPSRPYTLYQNTETVFSWLFR
jgi:hypothetical protein